MPPPRGGQGQGQGNSDNSLTPFWVMLTAAGAGYGIWYKAHEAIVAVLFHLQLIQIDIISLIFSPAILKSWANYMRTTPPGNVDWDHLMGACYAVGYYMRYPMGGALVGMAAWVYLNSVGLKFKRTFSMKTLRAQEQANWPQIMPVVTKDLTADDPLLGPWAMSMTPMEFSKQFNLLKKDEFSQRGVGHVSNPLTAAIKKGEARRIFTLQLGPYWGGFDALPPHTKALAAIFMAKVNRDRDGAAKFLKVLSISATKGHLDISMAKPLLDKHANTELIQEVVQKHAYVMTVMASLLEAARQDGVLASADFLWLKPIDRRLWYILNNVGRQTSFVEVAGIFAHWQVEKALDQPCLMPMIDEAVKALEMAIKEVKISPKEWGALQ